MAMPHRLEPGELFEERYRVSRIIGAGGFAVVYLAKQVDLEREVALKVMRPAKKLAEEGVEFGDSIYNDKIVGRFEREAKLVSQLRDPNTITMYDYGQSADGRLYMVFEFVDGITLKELLETELLSPERTVKILRQMLMSLQEAHSVGVLHRDIKPANVMVFDQVGRRDQIKLLDFGIATRALQDKKDLTQSLTEEGNILGTPRYMAPEQIQGNELTPASDLYSVGLVAYEMLTGRRAILGGSSIEVIGKQIAPESVRLPLDLGIPSRLRQILDKLLQKNPTLRYQDTAEVLEDLEGWEEDAAAGGPGDTTEMEVSFIVPAERDDPSDTHLVQQPDEREDVSSQTKPLYTLAAIVSLMVIGAVAYAVMDQEGSPPDDDASRAAASEATSEATTKATSTKPGADPPAGSDSKVNPSLEQQGELSAVEPSADERPADERPADEPAAPADSVSGEPAGAGEEPGQGDEDDPSARRKEVAEPEKRTQRRPAKSDTTAAAQNKPDKPEADQRKRDQAKRDKPAPADEGSDDTESGATEESSPFFTLD